MKQWIPDYAFVFHNITSEEHTDPEDPALYAVVSALQCTYETDEKVEERVILTFQKIGAAMREGEVSAYVKEVFGRVIYYVLIISVNGNRKLGQGGNRKHYHPGMELLGLFHTLLEAI